VAGVRQTVPGRHRREVLLLPLDGRRGLILVDGDGQHRLGRNLAAARPKRFGLGSGRGFRDRAAPLVAARAQPVFEPPLGRGKEGFPAHRRRRGHDRLVDHAALADEREINQEIIVQMMIELGAIGGDGQRVDPSHLATQGFCVLVH